MNEADKLRMQALHAAGEISRIGRCIVGGNGLNGRHQSCNIDHLSELARQLRQALDFYDALIIDLTQEMNK